ncbi:MAG: DUF1580 domain-containing protein [Planctomycetaceae bacterium]|nr:DUF1580 domain-containing protein [Planctomycetaceae bacterium]
MNLTDSLKDAIPLTKAADFVPGRPHSATIWRWATKGVRGVKLASWVSGGKRVTTLAAIEEFLRRLNAGAESPDSPDDAVRRSREASRALEKLGA